MYCNKESGLPITELQNQINNRIFDLYELSEIERCMIQSAI